MEDTKKDENRGVPFDQIVKRLLGTPPKPHVPAKVARKQTKKRKPAK